MKKLLKKHLIQCDKKLKKLFLVRKSDKNFSKTINLFQEKTCEKFVKHLSNITNLKRFCHKFFCNNCNSSFPYANELHRHQARNSCKVGIVKFISNSVIFKKITLEIQLIQFVPYCQLHKDKNYIFMSIHI